MHSDISACDYRRKQAYTKYKGNVLWVWTDRDVSSLVDALHFRVGFYVALTEL